MSYIQESLSPGEKIYKLTHYHWMYLLGAIIGSFMFMLGACFIIFLGIIYHYYDPMKLPPWKILTAASELAASDYLKAFWHINILFRVTGFILVLMALIQIGARLLVVATTEMAVTNRRIVFKRGWISRRVAEMRIDYIEGADVRQTILGRLLGYGLVRVSGTGSENITYPRFTADAINFKRALEQARSTVNNAMMMARNAPPQIEPDFGHNGSAHNDFTAPASYEVKNRVPPSYT